MRNKLFLIIILLTCVVMAQTKSVSKTEVNIISSDTIKSVTNQKTIQIVDSLVSIKGNFIPYKKNAHASYYADRFHGKRTASGAKFNMNSYTAAHKKLPFGTKLKVTNEDNGRFVIVEVNDRGPFVKGREIDLSKKAFMDLASKKGRGVMNVTLEILRNEKK